MIHSDDPKRPSQDTAARDSARLAEGGPAARRLAKALADGVPIDDWLFDRHLPAELRARSNEHWTPLFVVTRTLEWLESAGVRTVVDLGSGAGKFCVVGALSSRCTFVGVEQRPRLVTAARALAREFGVQDRVSFLRGVLGQCQLPSADAYYLFNPFGENLISRSSHIDAEVELSKTRYVQDIRYVQAFLAQVPKGTIVVKYNGFGSRMPEGFEVVRVDREMPCLLRMWRKTC